MDSADFTEHIETTITIIFEQHFKKTSVYLQWCECALYLNYTPHARGKARVTAPEGPPGTHAAGKAARALRRNGRVTLYALSYWAECSKDL